MVWIIISAFILDYFFSEPKRFHPLIGFGRWASWIENKLCSPSVLCGGLAWALAVLPWVILACVASYFFQDSSLVYGIFSVFILYLAIGWQSLVSHAKAIQTPLEQKNLTAARVAVSMIVSRNTSTMTDNEIAIATTESVLENGADAVFSAVFWFMVLGVPGVVLYRLSNTLDAMWGYKNEKYLYFGKVAALLDDALNFIPARITACLYALANLNR
ncbi:MAG: cobalamin biosynthesis protein, partial [Sinobacterium sp.]|nr:cobalamin biosynthesis protein [Sinobacterium sp.]